MCGTRAPSTEIISNCTPSSFNQVKTQWLHSFMNYSTGKELKVKSILHKYLFLKTKNTNREKYPTLMNSSLLSTSDQSYFIHFISERKYVHEMNVLCTKLFTKSMYKATRFCIFRSMMSRFQWNPVTIGLLAFNTIHKRGYLSRRRCTHRGFCHWIIGTEWNSSFLRQPRTLSIITFHFSTLLKIKKGKN